MIDNKAFELSTYATISADGITEFDYMWLYDGGPEVIWRIGFTTTSYGGALGTVFLNFTRDMTYFYPDYMPAEWVLNLYGTSDIRYWAYFADSSITGIETGYDFDIPVPLMVKYYGNRTFTPYYIYHVCMPKPLRLAEQYLIRAEAYCRQAAPDYSRASQDLTTLSNTRKGGAVSVSSSTWQETISDERVKELYMEGFRLNDLKRWHKGFERTPNSYTQTEGNDLKIVLDPSDPENPRTVMPEDQTISDELSVFGQMNGDNRILGMNSPAYTSYFNSCQKFVSLWMRAYVYDMSTLIGYVGDFYNVMEWVSDEEADRLRREEGM